MRPTELIPEIMIGELLRLHKLDPHWVRWIPLDGDRYEARRSIPSWIDQYCFSGADYFAMYASSVWLAEGPKCFVASAEHCMALEQIEVNLTLADYSQPYPALLVVLPKGRYEPFTSVLCHQTEHVITCVLRSVGNRNDVTTTIARKHSLIEESIQRFDEDCRIDAPTAALALRVACNSCLALSNYGNHLNYLFPKEVERDQRLSKEKSERGERARQRLPLAMMVASFDQEVHLHRTETRQHDGAETGRAVSTHWRKGHWAMQPYGPGHSLRKRILRPPVLVRADLFTGEKAATGTTYS